jgi:hypothetical protein
MAKERNEVVFIKQALNRLASEPPSNGVSRGGAYRHAEQTGQQPQKQTAKFLIRLGKVRA